MPIESDDLVTAKINALNESSPEGEKTWLALNGFNALVQFNFLPNNGASFTGNSGYPVKVFVNPTTGEVKMFPAIQFTTIG